MFSSKAILSPASQAWQAANLITKWIHHSSYVVIDGDSSSLTFSGRVMTNELCWSPIGPAIILL